MMSLDKIWLSSPHMGGTERNFVTEAFDTNWVAPLEAYQAENTHVAALSSGTAAIHLALIQAGVGPGDEVICQSFTFCGTTNPVQYLGATPIMIDSEEQTWNMCPVALKEAVEDRIAKGKKPKAILAVHLYGMPYKVEEIHAFAKAKQIPVIEDSAESLGSTYKGQKCGTFGDYGILSFNGNKIITTSGGGAMVCPTKVVKDKTIFLATQARDEALHYQHSELGYNYRLSNISAGIGRGQMEVLDKHIDLRRAMNSFYQELFKDIAGVRVHVGQNAAIFSNHWLSAILVDPSKTGGITREDIRLALEKENIESRPLWKPMHLQPLCKDFPYYGGKICETLFENGLCLPSGSNLTDQDRGRIEKAIKQLFKI